MGGVEPMRVQKTTGSGHHLRQGGRQKGRRGGSDNGVVRQARAGVGERVGFGFHHFRDAFEQDPYVRQQSAGFVPSMYAHPPEDGLDRIGGHDAELHHREQLSPHIVERVLAQDFEGFGAPLLGIDQEDALSGARIGQCDTASHPARAQGGDGRPGHGVAPRVSTALN
jgi:hypothetical protein